MPIIVPDNLSKRIEEELMIFNERIELELLRRLQYIGEHAVNEARRNHAYKDQTGNLTSSIGYAIFKDGELWHISHFNQKYNSKKKKSIEGTLEGANYARSLASQYPEGIALVVVAGMDYAAYVERRGLGGMTGAELQAKEEVEKLLVSLTKQTYRKDEQLSRRYEHYAKQIK